MTRILLADDHEIVLEGIRTILGRAERDWEICGEARNGKDAVEMVLALKPDLVVLDVTMPIMSGLQAAKQIRESQPGCRILIFTMHESERLGQEVKQTGAHGFVLKSQAARDLVRAIDALVGGDTFYGAAAEQEKGAGPNKPERGPIFFQALAFA
jgi:DNA-binding NarL/FixJ family response regulator